MWNSILVIAAIVFPLGITIWNTLDGIKWNSIRWGKRILILTVIAGALVAAWKAYTDLKTNKENTELEDRINSKIGDISGHADIAFPLVEIGRSGTKFKFPNGIFGFPGTKYLNLFKFYIKNKTLFADVLIRDSKAEAIAAIEDNTWTIIKSGYEYNGDDSAFELVTEGDRKVYFQLQYSNGEIQVAGLFYTANRDGIYWSESSNGASMFTFSRDSTFILPDEIKPLFKYPRAKYSKIEGIRVSN
jgi:hypothetical protein